MTKTERERLQEIACDICHQPYACANEDELAKACEECPISAEMCEMEEDKPKWIPVTERMPKHAYGEGDSVLTVSSLGNMRVLYFDGGNWCYPTGEPLTTVRKYPITHWMPLPEPPEEETDGTT